MRSKDCDCLPNDILLVEALKKDMGKNENISVVSRFFKVIGDETRMRIMFVLSQNEVSVNDIAVVLNMTKSAISHQLKILKEEGHIKSTKRGKNIFYSLDDMHVVEILQKAVEHTGHLL